VNLQYFIIYLFVAILGVTYYLGLIPPLIILLFIIVSAFAYERYAKDKKAALKGEWRVPEKTLHILSLLCGWPGAIIAQQRLRHKTKKVNFKVIFWLTILMNIGGFSWLHTNQGSLMLRHSMFALENLSIEHISSKKAVNIVLFLTRFRSNFR
jgi:uncharacterized membrane protein YsdA (DUF1294 family)